MTLENEPLSLLNKLGLWVQDIVDIAAGIRLGAKIQRATPNPVYYKLETPRFMGIKGQIGLEDAIGMVLGHYDALCPIVEIARQHYPVPSILPHKFMRLPTRLVLARSVGSYCVGRDGA